MTRMRGEVQDEIELMRRIIHHAFWDVFYHQHELKDVHKQIACLRALLERCGMGNLSLAYALEFYEQDGNEESKWYGDVKDWITYKAGEIASGLHYEEQELTKAMAELASAKALLIRTGIELPLEEIEEEERKRVYEK